MSTSVNQTIEYCLHSDSPIVRRLAEIAKNRDEVYQENKKELHAKIRSEIEANKQIRSLKSQLKKAQKKVGDYDRLHCSYNEVRSVNVRMDKVIKIARSKLDSGCADLGINTKDKTIPQMIDSLLYTAKKLNKNCSKMEEQNTKIRTGQATVQDKKNELLEKENAQLRKQLEAANAKIDSLEHSLESTLLELQNAEIKCDRLTKGNSETTNLPSSFDVCAKSKSNSSKVKEAASQKEAASDSTSATDREIEKQKKIVRVPTSSKKKTGNPRGRKKGDHTDHRKGLAENPDHIRIRMVTAAPTGAVECTDENGKTYYAVQMSDLEMVNTITETRYYIDRNGEKLSEEELNRFKISRFVYSSKIKALCLFLLFYCRVPYHRVVQALYSLTASKVALAESTIVKWSGLLSKGSKPLTEESLQRILNEEVLYADETGFKIAGKQYWMHVLASGTEAFYVVTKSRGDKDVGPVGILKKAGYRGTLVTDHFASYRVLTDLIHAECNVHIERYMRNGEIFDKCPACTQMLDFFHDLRSLKTERLAMNETGLSDEELAATKEKFIKICVEGMEHWEKVLSQVEDPERLKPYIPPYYKTFRRMKETPEDYLRFMEDFDIPFGNNRAEQLIQKAKSKMRVSRQCVSEKGAEIVADVLSIMETARTSGSDIYEMFLEILS